MTWREIPDHPTYFASAGGKIRRVRDGRKPLVLKPTVKEDGYHRVAVWLDGRRVWRSVHKLVCLAYHGPQPDKQSMACHRDGNKDRNEYRNLYWGDAKSNYLDAVRHGTANIMPVAKTPKKKPKTTQPTEKPAHPVGTPAPLLKEWYNRDRVLNRRALGAYERGKFGGVLSPKKRAGLRKEAKSKGYSVNVRRA